MQTGNEECKLEMKNSNRKLRNANSRATTSPLLRGGGKGGNSSADRNLTGKMCAHPSPLLEGGGRNFGLSKWTSGHFNKIRKHLSVSPYAPISIQRLSFQEFRTVLKFIPRKVSLPGVEEMFRGGGCLFAMGHNDSIESLHAVAKGPPLKITEQYPPTEQHPKNRAPERARKHVPKWSPLLFVK